MVKNFPFQISAGLPGGGTLSLAGAAGPIDQHDASATPVNAKLDLSHFDPVAAGLVDPSQGLSMLAVVSAQIASDGKMLAANGSIDASRLKLSANGSPAPHPVQIRFSIHDNLVARTGTIDSLNLGTGAVGVNVTGSYSIAGPGATPMTLDLQVAAPKVPVDQIEALLPAAGLRLPSGSSLSGGVFTANLKVTGPANALTIAGPVEIDGTRLAGFDLGSKIEGLKPVSGSQGGTEIQTVRAEVTSSPAGIAIQNLYTSVPALGTATGSGTVSPAGNLNFHILARLNPGAGVAGQALSGLSAASGSLGSLVSAVAAKGIPVDITGTTSNPQIRADMTGLLRQNATGLLKSTNPGTLLNKFLPH
jgi:AsmA protein